MNRGTWYVLFAILFVVIVIVCGGCATTADPKPVIGELRTATVKIAVPVACKPQLPPRPTTAAPPPGSDVARQMAGIAADADAFASYSAELESALKACARDPQPGGPKP